MQKCKPSLLTLCMLMSFPVVGAVIFTPALARLVNDFGISTGLSQMTVAVYLGGYALGQLPYSWLCARYGHKSAIYIGIGIFIFGSALCAWAPTFGWLMVGRAVMALGAAVGLMMTFTLVSQFYSVDEARSIFAYTAISMAIAPGLANLVGGLLTGFLGWKSCFYFLILYALLLGTSAKRLPNIENREDRAVFSLRSYVSALTNPRFLTLTFASALTTALVYVFASTAPLTTIYLLEVAPQVYGFVSLIPFIGTVSGCFVSAALAEKLSAHKAIGLGVGVSFTGALLKWLLVQVFGLHVWTLFAPMPLIYFGLPFVYSNGAAIGLSLIEDKTVGSSIFCVGNIGLSLLGVLMMGWMGISSITRLPIVFLGMMALMATLFVVNLFLGKGDVAATQPANES